MFELAQMPSAVILVLVMVLLGWSFRQLKVLPDNSADTLNRLVLQLCFPALVLSLVPGIAISKVIIWIALIAWLVMGISALLIVFSARALKLPRDVEGCLLLTGVLGNTAFLGYPMVKAYIGPEQLSAAVMYDQLGSFLVFSTFGLWIAARYGGGKSPSLGATLKRIVSFPSFVALAVGLTLNLLHIQLPDWSLVLLRDIGALLVPLAMFAVGLNLRLSAAPGLGLPLALGLGVKMLVAPLLALGLASFLLPQELYSTVLLQAAMPPMATAAALAASANLRPNLAAALAGFGVLLIQLWTPILLRLVPN